MLLRSALVVLAFVVFAGPSRAETLQRTVKANTRTPIGAFSSYEFEGCYQAPIPAASVRQKPAHGTVAIEVHEIPIRTDRCAGRTIRSPIFIYTPARGFKGDDLVSIDVPSSPTVGGRETLLTYTYAITVE